MKKILFAAVACATLLLTGCMTTPYQPTKTPMELQAIQTKEFDTDKKTAFTSVLSVLQDLGYIIGSADMETGLITAKSPTSQDFVPFVGQRMQDTKVNAFVEQIAKGRAKIRINFIKSVQTYSGYGMKGENEHPIEEGEMYQEVFAKIQQAIFVRSNL